MFPLNRMFIQSEDARHGGPFGRAAYVMDAILHKTTPPCPIDDSKREYTKWMSIVDMRDYMLLHTPICWSIINITSALAINLFLSILLGVTLIITVIYYNDVLTELIIGFLFLFSIVMLYILNQYGTLTKESGLELIKQIRFPDIPIRGEYAENLVSRGVFSESLWLTQFALDYLHYYIQVLLKYVFHF